MTRIRGPVYKGRSGKRDKRDAHAFIWCSRVDQGKRIVGRNFVEGRNCVIEVAQTRKCTVVDIDGNRVPANCINYANIYEGPPGHRVVYRNHGRKK